MPEELDDLNDGQREINISNEFSGIKFNLVGQSTDLSLDGVKGTIEGPQGIFLIDVVLKKDGDNYLINGTGSFVKPPLEGTISGSVQTDEKFVPDMSTLETQGQVSVDKEVSGVHINLNGTVENGRLSSLSGTVEGLGGSYVISASIVDNGSGYTITGSADFAIGPVTGSATAQIQADDSFNIDPGSLDISGSAEVHKEISGVNINLAGTLEHGRLASLQGTVEGLGGSYVITASVVDNGEGYTITGGADFSAGPVQGSVSAQIDADNNFQIQPESLNISGNVELAKDVAGFNINLKGALERGRLASLIGTVEGMGGSLLISASLVDNGEGYTITGSGQFAKDGIQGSIGAQIEADDNFHIDPGTLNIFGTITYSKEMSSMKIDMTGSIANGRFAEFIGSITGPNDSFQLLVAVTDNGDGYTILGQGAFVAGPVQGNIIGQIDTDNSFEIQPDSLLISGDISVDTNLAGLQIYMSGSVVENKLASLMGTITGPENLFELSVSVVDNDEGYTITGSGEFTAGIVSGDLIGQIDTDKSFNPKIETLDIGGSVNVNAALPGVSVEMTGTMAHNRFQSLVGTIEGPGGMFVLIASVVDNGEGYSIHGEGDFKVGPLEGIIIGDVDTDDNFNPIMDTLQIGGGVGVDTEVGGHHITMHGTMLNGRLEHLDGLVVGPNELYTISVTIDDNGEGSGYKIIGDGAVDLPDAGIKGTVHGEIETDDAFHPNFETLKFSGEVTIDKEAGGGHITGSAVVRNGYLESVTAEYVDAAGTYKLYGQATREDGGYDLEAGGEFQLLDYKMEEEFPPIIIPSPIPGLDFAIEIDVGFSAKMSAFMIMGMKTDEHFIPDISTLEVRSATIIAHLEAFLDLIALIEVNLGIAEIGVGIKARLAAIIDAFFTLHADSKGVHFSGDMYGALLGQLYALIHMKFLFFKKDFEFLLVEGKVASVEKEFGPEPFTIGNLIKALMFDFSDLSIPGKERKGKTPSMEDQRKKNQEHVDSAADEDQKAKEDDAKAKAGDDAKDPSEDDNPPDGEPEKKLSDQDKKDKFKKDGGNDENQDGDSAQMVSKDKNSTKDNIQLKSKEKSENENLLTEPLEINPISDSVQMVINEDSSTFEANDQNYEDTIQKKGTNDEFSLDDSIQMKAEDMETENELSNDSIQMKAEVVETENELSNDSIQMKAENLNIENELSDDSIQMKAEDVENKNELSDDLVQMKSDNNSSSQSTVQAKSEGNLPGGLKSGVESLSGQNMSNVNVHYNSPEPEKMNAHAYAQGNNIHLGPGQEKHLPHEAWHVAQQKQGRVKPTKQLKSKINVNDDPSLEREADVMGAKAEKLGKSNEEQLNNLQNRVNKSESVSQLIAFDKSLNNDLSSENKSENNIEESSSISNEQTAETITN